MNMAGNGQQANTHIGKYPMQWRLAFRALRKLIRNNDDTTQVFAITDALRGNSDARNTARMRQSAFGRTILSKKSSLVPILADHSRLRQLPEGSLGRAYLDFMESENLSADGLVEAADEGHQTEGIDPEITAYANRVRDSHDIWHVLTGYGRDPLGELALLGVMYSQVKNLGMAFIALLALPNIAKTYPGAPTKRAVLQGFRTGRRAKWLVAQDWETLLAYPLESVRTTLQIDPPSYYLRCLPNFDAASSNSDAALRKA